MRRPRAAWTATLSLLLLTPGLALQDDTAEAEAASEGPAAPVKLSRLQGSASLGRNRQVVGATVLVRPQESSSRLFVTTSDYRGHFRIEDLPDGDYRVEVRREGLRPVVKENIGLRFPFRAVVELTMQSLGPGDAPLQAAPPAGGTEAPLTVLGKVVERNGGALPEVDLRLVRTDGSVDPLEVRSDDDGGFDLATIPGGEWRLEARVVGFLPIWTRMEFREDTELTISMVPQPAAYEPSPLELMPPEQPIPPQTLALD